MTYAELLNTLLSPTVAFIVGLMTATISRNASRSQIAKERLEKVYHPLFLSIEPFLYKEVVFEEITPFIECYCVLEEKYSLFIQPSFRQHMKSLCCRRKLQEADKYSDAEWVTICDYISKEYDRLCRQAHIPLRSTGYRLDHKQYRSKFSMYLGLLLINLPAIIVCSVVIAVIHPLLLITTYLLVVIFLINNFFDS